MSTDVAAGSLSAITASYKPLTEGTVSFLTKTASAIDYLGDEVEGTVTESGIMEALAHATRGVGALRPTQDQMADWAALSAAIMSAGQTGDHTGEIISKVFRTLQSDGAKIAPLLGMNIKKYEEELKRDPFAILDKIREKYTKLDTTGKSELAGALGDAYGQQLASLLFADERKWQIYQEARKGAKEAYSSGDRIGESFAKSAAGTQAQWSVLTQTFTVLGQVLGMTVLPAINVLLTTLNAFLGPMAMIIEKFIELAGSIPGADIIALSVGLTIVGGAIVLTAGFASVLAARFGLAALATEIWSASIGVLRGVMTALMTSNPLGWVIIAITLIGAILYKTGALQKAFDWFKNTSFGGGIIDFLSKLMSGEIDFSSLKNAFGGAIGIAMTISPMGWMVKLFSGVTEWLSKIFSATDPLEGVLEYANEWLKSITNFFSWLNSQFSSFIDWLKAGLGITRSEKQSALDEYVGKMGYKWVDLGDVTKDDPFWYIGARYYTSKNQPVSDAMLDKLISERDKAPKGIFEKTFEAIPGLSELCDAINSLREKIEEWLKKIGIGGEPAGTPAEKYRIDESTGKVYQGSTEVYYDKTMGAYTFVPPAAPAAPATPSAIGAHFAGGGLFTGIVHASEEITPLAVSQQGPGPISRALADLYSFYATKPSDTSESPGKIEVNINIDSVSSDVDIKKIGEEAASGLRSEWTKLQRRNSAYLRGGSICR
jgi:TP901 family phage tail tape measure protein